jgi:hypothetical protein
MEEKKKTWPEAVYLHMVMYQSHAGLYPRSARSQLSRYSAQLARRFYIIIYLLCGTRYVHRACACAG